MANPHDAMVSQLASLLTDYLRDHLRCSVVTNGRWQPLEEFPKYILAFDLIVVDRDARWLSDEGGAVLAPLSAPVTAFDVIASNPLPCDLYEKPDLLNLTGLCEYAVYDPTSEVLRPPLQVFRSDKGV